MPHTRVSSSIDISAPADVIFDILANPHRHAEIDGSGTVVGDVEGPDRLSQGAVFRVRMKNGVGYTSTNTIVEFEEDRLIAWRPMGDLRWRYALEPVGDSTLVTETWDITTLPVPAQWLLRLLGVPGRTRRSIDATLIRLKDVAEAAVGPVDSGPLTAW